MINFMDFQQLSERHKDSPREAGLGLSICKNLIEKMGGGVKVVSSSDEGTVFTVQMIEISRIGQDKREKFTIEEEIKFEKLMEEAEIIEEKADKLSKSVMGLIKERGSMSEDGNESSSFVSE